ncbi:TPA: hypothetical protein DEO28_04000 [Candidatus Dependentiae bacterium]|nr:MAG: hypothetical protein UR14_C0006G0037 [candidate division TM6 bacterium GW2011_GWE2_31_21]KKP53540.1 MAG: hypothetical protein UR43_C0004G0081 [candidate division TM6 bacterium GW2011_GWF2_33_332]HBS48219.1 hypothetical protein [Candidatus Dependentiae bacterium]HBZ73645.1 hypothetical protein [Candidatus Dependentiae bacterium]
MNIKKSLSVACLLIYCVVNAKSDYQNFDKTLQSVFVKTDEYASQMPQDAKSVAKNKSNYAIFLQEKNKLLKIRDMLQKEFNNPRIAALLEQDMRVRELKNNLDRLFDFRYLRTAFDSINVENEYEKMRLFFQLWRKDFISYQHAIEMFISKKDSFDKDVVDLLTTIREFSSVMVVVCDQIIEYLNNNEDSGLVLFLNQFFANQSWYTNYAVLGGIGLAVIVIAAVLIGGKNYFGSNGDEDDSEVPTKGGLLKSSDKPKRMSDCRTIGPKMGKDLRDIEHSWDLLPEISHFKVRLAAWFRIK